MRKAQIVQGGGNECGRQEEQGGSTMPLRMKALELGRFGSRARLAV